MVSNVLKLFVAETRNLVYIKMTSIVSVSYKLDNTNNSLHLIFLVEGGKEYKYIYTGTITVVRNALISRIDKLINFIILNSTTDIVEIIDIDYLFMKFFSRK